MAAKKNPRKKMGLIKRSEATVEVKEKKGGPRKALSEERKTKRIQALKKSGLYAILHAQKKKSNKKEPRDWNEDKDALAEYFKDNPGETAVSKDDPLYKTWVSFQRDCSYHELVTVEKEESRSEDDDDEEDEGEDD